MSTVMAPVASGPVGSEGRGEQAWLKPNAGGHCNVTSLQPLLRSPASFSFHPLTLMFQLKNHSQKCEGGGVPRTECEGREQGYAQVTRFVLPFCSQGKLQGFGWQG